MSNKQNRKAEKKSEDVDDSVNDDHKGNVDTDNTNDKDDDDDDDGNDDKGWFQLSVCHQLNRARIKPTSSLKRMFESASDQIFNAFQTDLKKTIIFGTSLSYPILPLFYLSHPS